MSDLKKRVNYCDFIRFFAICSVVLIHVLADFRDNYLIINKHYYFILTFIDSFTRAGVPIFFMLTGAFVLSSKKEEKYLSFIKTKVLKLIIPFFFISLLYYFYEKMKINGSFSFIDFINLFTANQIKYHFWFMYSIILIYFLIPFLKKLVHSIDKSQIEILIIIGFISNVLLCINNISKVFSLNLFSSFVFPNLFIYICYLFLGYYLYNYDLRKKNLLYYLSIISLILMPFFDYYTTTNFRLDSFLVATSPFSFILAAGIFVFIKNNYSNYKALSHFNVFFNNTSKFIFYIYMIHVIVMENIKKIMLIIFTPSRFVSTLFFILIEFIITFAISYLLGMLLYYIYKKVESLIINYSKKNSY